ncbi:hypothetical protein QDA04_gp20 [Microbacterium phage Megan]|uniref:Uncharacterized protein n=1 Tax=Microbacterium phage Megan TaxID=2656551 RepID=A0A649VJX9_9CAUD|nr:hypothetical protein QDA04_gp20 [Microbacterium phage Megan]QGJ92690.1 hypothetical protein PBI_MEGAN_20 [Microbacterium phage Megan]
MIRMACGCNKGKTDDSAARAQRATANAARKPAEPAPQMQGSRVRTVPVMQGGQQSFALQRDGRTQSFGSDLEARAERARRGGTLV